MPRDHSRRPLSVLASALAPVGVVLAVAGCSNIAPLGPDPAPVRLPPARDLRSPIVMQMMRRQPPTPADRCPLGSVDLFGLDPTVPRVLSQRSVHVFRKKLLTGGTGSTATPTASATTTPSAPAAGVGIACYRPVGKPLTITTAAVSSVTTHRNQPGPAWYVFVVAFPAADVPALTTLIRQAFHSGDALGMSVAGRLWQAPQPRSRFNALRAEQINLLSRNQALRLYRLLVPPG